jgi:UDP-N-acetylbacillosamine N-acetyltransferase
MKSIYIYGASGHGLVVADIAEVCGYDNITLIDDGDNSYLSFDDIKDNPDRAIALAIGDNRVRREIYKKVKYHGFKIETLVHKSAVVSKSATLGEGTVVMAGAVVNPYSRIGVAVIVNSSSTVEHESVVGDFVHISPNVALAGGVKVESGTHIGIGSSIIQGVTIGRDSIVGAGSVVVRDISSRSVAYGNPCRVIRKVYER